MREVYPKRRHWLRNLVLQVGLLTYRAVETACCKECSACNVTFRRGADLVLLGLLAVDVTHRWHTVCCCVRLYVCSNIIFL